MSQLDADKADRRLCSECCGLIGENLRKSADELDFVSNLGPIYASPE